MPDPAQRKQRKKALERARDKYIDCPDTSNPQKVFPPIREHTEAVRAVMNTKNYVRILTQLDKNLFIMAQYYLYCDEDIWACGDAMVFNCNPDKKIMMKPMCSKSKTDCICYHEASKHFITICPSCKKVVDMIQATAFKCDHCGFQIPYNKVDDMPFAKIPCDWCPREIGWDKVQELSDMIFGRLQARQHTVMKMIDDDMNSFMERMTNARPQQ